MAPARRESLHQITQVRLALPSRLGETHSNRDLGLLNDQAHGLQPAEHQARRVAPLNPERARDANHDGAVAPLNLPALRSPLAEPGGDARVVQIAL